MVWPLLIAGLGGAWMAKGRGPKAKTKKLTSLGSATGLTYEVDDLVDQAMVIVHYKGTSAVFKRVEPSGFHYVDGKGHPDVLVAMIQDFMPKKDGGRQEPPTGSV